MHILHERPDLRPVPVYLLAHEYFGVDLEIVWEIIKDDLPVLISEVESIMEQAKKAE